MSFTIPHPNAERVEPAEPGSTARRQAGFILRYPPLLRALAGDLPTARLHPSALRFATSKARQTTRQQVLLFTKKHPAQPQTPQMGFVATA